jgi:hypothetical protein
MADHIVVGQDFTLEYVSSEDIDLTNATTILLKYKKPPDGTAGQFTAAAKSPAATSNTITYDVKDTENDQAGRWRFWPHVTFSDGTIRIGKPVEVEVYGEGELGC